uniref:Uncharacterized protein n=1 Tax=Anguilla anguilla TaxID=7936 RepID=A0A0E9VII1_ANGAN
MSGGEVRVGFGSGTSDGRAHMFQFKGPA